MTILLLPPPAPLFPFVNDSFAFHVHFSSPPLHSSIPRLYAFVRFDPSSLGSRLQPPMLSIARRSSYTHAHSYTHVCMSACAAAGAADTPLGPIKSALTSAKECEVLKPLDCHVRHVVQAQASFGRISLVMSLQSLRS